MTFGTPTLCRLAVMVTTALATGAVVNQPLNPPPGWLDWLKRRQPVDIIGRTIRPYYVPESALPAASTAAP